MTELHGDVITQHANETRPADNQAAALSRQVQHIAESDAQSRLPAGGLSRFVATTEEGVKDFLPGVKHTLVDHWENVALNAVTAAGMGLAGRVLLPETGPLGALAGVGLGVYFGVSSGLPVYRAYKTGIETGDIKAAGRELGDALGGLAVNLPIGIYAYKLGGGAGNRLMMSESLDGFADWKAARLGPINNKLERAIESGTVTISNVLHGKFEIANASSAASAHRFQSRFSLNDDGTADLLASHREAPMAGTLKGDVDASEPLSVQVVLKSKATDLKLDRMNRRIVLGQREALGDAELGEKFGPDARAVDALERFAEQHGLTIGRHNDATGMFQLKGSAAQMQDAFGVKLKEYVNDSGQSFHARTGTIKTSAELAPHIEGVFGLDNRPQFKTNLVRLGDGAQTSVKAGSEEHAGGPSPRAESGLDPERVFKAYKFPEDMKGDGLKASFTSLGGVEPRGLDDWLAARGARGGIKVKVLDGQELISDPQGADVENALDAGIIKTGLPDAEVTMIAGDNSDAGFMQTIDEAGRNKSTVHSISWGMNEENWTDQGIRGMALAAKKASAQGTTVVAAAGDNGAMDNARDGRYATDVPSALAEITGVGGTWLKLGRDGERLSEQAWSTDGATGGGRSEKIPRPDYQKGMKLPANANGSSFDGIGKPDIAFNADPKSGTKVFTEDGEVSVGGTSAAAPYAAVLFGKTAQAVGKPLGYMNPTIYALGKKDPSVFWDVTEGDNGGYQAGPGWDATTGWGSVNGEKFVAAITKGSKPAHK